MLQKKKWHVYHACDMTYGMIIHMGMQTDKFINDFNDFLLFWFIFYLCDCVHVYTVLH